MPISVLVIDADVSIVDAFEKVLGRQGFVILRAYSAAAGLEILRQSEVDAVIADVCVPGAPDVAFLREIKALYSTLPIVVMTAYSTSFTQADALREGAYGYFVKPFNLNDLMRTLKRATGSQDALVMSEGKVQRSRILE